ncbi:MAG TPA: benenodin family lasso peptide [Sphingomonas sp.]|nr:benenodin family lasso peptide [Sphingomonas sp.]
MEREDEVIELGTATVETKGGSGLVIDAKNGQQPFGIAND